MHMRHRLDAGKFSRSALRRLQTLARVEIPDRLRRYRAEYAHGAGSIQVFRNTNRFWNILTHFSVGSKS